MDDFKKRNQMLVFFNLKPSIVRSFKAVKPSEFKHCNTLQDLDTILKGQYSITISISLVGEQINHILGQEEILCTSRMSAGTVQCTPITW